MMKRCMLAVALVGLLALSASAEVGVGALFSLGSSARSLGMGGAFMALADDEGAIQYSPPALGRIRSFGLTSLVSSGFGGTVSGVVGFAMPFVGLAGFLFDSGAIPTDEGSFRYAAQGMMGSVGIPIGPVSLGVRARVFRAATPVEGTGWAVDPAVLIAVDSIRVGMMVEAAWSEPVTYSTGSREAWEPSLRIGASMTLSPSPDVRWSAAFEAGGLFSLLPSLAIGLETWIGGLGARVGFDGHGPTFGLSALLADLQFDWAYAMREDLSDSHRVSLTYRF